MKSTKYKIHRLSKYEFPTRIVKKDSRSGALVIGHIPARRELEDRLGRSVGHMVQTDTPFEWLFKEPLR